VWPCVPLTIGPDDDNEIDYEAIGESQERYMQNRKRPSFYQTKHIYQNWPETVENYSDILT